MGYNYICSIVLLSISFYLVISISFLFYKKLIKIDEWIKFVSFQIYGYIFFFLIFPSSCNYLKRYLVNYINFHYFNLNKLFAFFLGIIFFGITNEVNIENFLL